MTLASYAKISVLVFALLLQAACGLSRRSIREATLTDGDLLDHAGFSRFSVAAPDKRQLIAHMEPGKIFFYKPMSSFERLDPTYGDNRRALTRYWYFDPFNCNCVYVGTETDYIKYKRLKIEAELEKDRELAAARDAALVQLIVGTSPLLREPITTERITDDQPTSGY
jgi:hypothetical protein